MYARVLAAVNEHLNAEVAARYALFLAKACGAKFYTCFIAGKDTPPAVIERAGETTRRLFLDAENAGLEAEILMETGEPVEEIGKIVRHENITIVVAATRREDTERRFFTGTVARRLTLRLPCSVALVRVVHMGRIHPKKILVPLKAAIGRIRERAFFTARLAEACGSSVYLFHVPKHLTGFFHGQTHLTPPEWEKRTPADILTFAEHLRHWGIEAEHRLLPGSTGRGIAIEAAVRRNDLIIMGASERSLLRSLFMGNPVELMLRETPCNLIILKPHYED